jgi:hypothetical protein
MHTKNFSIQSYELFEDEINQSYLFHIPHSRTLIPDYTGFSLDRISKEIHLLTDFLYGRNFHH